MPLLVRTCALACAAAFVVSTARAQSATAAAGVKLSGYIQARMVYMDEAGITTSINRARLSAGGPIASDFTWRIQGEFRTGNVGTGKASVSLQDAFIRWQHREIGVQAGQFKTPFTREFVTSLADLETADRSTVVDSLAPKRDLGLMGEYVYRGAATLSVGVFNGEGQNVTTNTDSTVLGVARFVVRPIPVIALGANVARYFGDSTRYGFDANYESPMVTLRGEYVAQARDSIGGEDDHGWYALGAVKVVPVVQLVGKYEDFRKDAIDPQRRNQAWTAAANLFLHGTAVKLTLEYVSRKIGDPGTRKGLGLAQLQARF